jgi:hypothetical protein
MELGLRPRGTSAVRRRLEKRGVMAVWGEGEISLNFRSSTITYYHFWRRLRTKQIPCECPSLCDGDPLGTNCRA